MKSFESIRNTEPLGFKNSKAFYILTKTFHLKSFIPRAIGAELSEEAEETLRFRPNLPKAFIYVSSPLSVKLRYHDSYPLATAWTMFETKQRRNPYRYTYFTFNPSNEDNFAEATEFLREYVRHYDGKRIVTDNDGIVPRLEASIPISTNPLRKKLKEARELLLRLDDWAKTALKKLDYERW